MAQYPCSIHGGRYAGPQQSLYPAILNGNSANRTKLRACPSCFRDQLNFLEGHFTEATEALAEFSDNPSQCGVCLDDVQRSGAAAFMTTYDREQNRLDWFAPVHEGCVPELIALFHLPAADR